MRSGIIVDEKVGSMVSSSGRLLAVVPIMTLATAYGAWQHGILRVWWSYSEM